MPGFVGATYHHKLRIPMESLHVAIADAAALPRRFCVHCCRDTSVAVMGSAAVEALVEGGGGRGFFEAVGDVDEGEGAGACEAVDGGADGAFACLVKSVEGLVKDEERRCFDECACEEEEPLFAG